MRGAVTAGPHAPGMHRHLDHVVPARDRSGPARCVSANRLQPRLQHDWERLRRCPDHVVTARGWRVTHVEFDDLHDLLVLAGYERRDDPAADAVLLRLVLLARAEPLAARIVLQRILPGLLALVRRRSHQRRGSDGVFEELAAAAWIVIRDYDPRRRPSYLAAALISGADHLAFGRELRRRDPVDPCDPHQLDLVIDPAPPTAADELAVVLTEARDAGVGDDDLALLRGLVDVGGPAALANELGVTSRTVRNRRDRVTDRLRRVALAA